MTRSPIHRPAVLAVLAALLAVPAWGQDFPRLGLHGRIYGNGFPLIEGGTIWGPLNDAAITAYARYHELTIPASPISEYRHDVAQTLRARRPDIRLFGYVIGHYIWDGTDDPDSLVHFATRYRRLVRDLDGYLYNQAGGTYGAANVNLAKRTNGRYVVAEGLADLFHDAVASTGLWDGIFIDQFCNGILWSETATEKIDYVRAGYPSLAAFDAAWLAATDTLANRLRRLAGPDFLMVGNCGQGTKYASFNGWMRENFPFQNGGTWYTNMYAEPGGYFTDDLRFRPPAHNYLFTAAGSFDPYDSNNRRKVRFGLGSAALGEGYNVFGPSNLDALRYAYHHWWYDEYAVDLTTARADSLPSHTGWLGRPLTAAHQMIWIGPGPDGVVNSGAETDLSGWTFTNNGIPSTWERDVATSAVGAASIHVTANARAGADWSVNLTNAGQLAVTANGLYSATFWARASRATRFRVSIGTPGAGTVAVRAVDVDTAWRQYQVALTPIVSQTVQLQFYVGQIEGELWLDDVHLQAGASTLFRRDFQNGIVLVNPATTSMTVPLGRTFQKILGFRDPGINDGAFVTQVTVFASDALFLIGQDVTPPAAVVDLRPTPQ